ncbi:hypothetical protein C9426_34455 [Serratia sp. S1B]|nr:hypothetical protein C9426_34455 [Serratia sp. S1B]
MLIEDGIELLSSIDRNFLRENILFIIQNFILAKIKNHQVFIQQIVLIQKTCCYIANCLVLAVAGISQKLFLCF